MEKSSTQHLFCQFKKVDSKEILSKMGKMVERKRMVAELKVINNFQDQKELSDYVRIKSYEADLILMKLPKLISGEEKHLSNLPIIYLIKLGQHF